MPGRWIPASECPFTFIDTDGDGASEVVLRFSAVPKDFDRAAEPDWANRWAIHLGPFLPMMKEMGVAAIRYSFDVDNLSGQAQPHHYEMGFNLNGFVPYAFEGMERSNRAAPAAANEPRPPAGPRPARSPTATPPPRPDFPSANSPTAPSTSAIPSATANTTSAGRASSGCGAASSCRTRADRCRPGTSAASSRPNQRDRRRVYYSPVDRRLHLKGAEQGWLRVGAIHDQEPIGEWRMYDTDGDGYFDRWEWSDAGAGEPYRVAEVRDVRQPRFRRRLR